MGKLWMCRPNKIIDYITIFCLCLICVFPDKIFAQYAKDERLAFAGYYFKTGNYSTALKEYTYLNSQQFDSAIQFKIISCHFLLSNFDSVRKHILKSNSAPYSYGRILEFTDLEYKYNTYNLPLKKFELEHSNFTNAAYSFLNKNPAADYFFTDTFYSNSYSIMQAEYAKFKNYKVKNAFVAGAFSAVIPGSGKIYAGRPLEAVAPFARVLLCGLVAYEGYRKNGLRSPVFYLSAGAGTFFYISSIWGSVNAAKAENKKHEQEYTQAIMRRLRFGMQHLLQQY